jgi:MORN repeat protein
LRLILLTIILATCLPLAAAEFSCPEGTELQGKAPPDGLELKCVLADGSLHGPYQHWYSNGQLMQSLHYDHGKEHGEQKAWWPNGQKMMEGTSMNGKRYQGFRYWDISGKESSIQFETIDEML